MIEGMSYFLNIGSYISLAPMSVTSCKLFPQTISDPLLNST